MDILIFKLLLYAIPPLKKKKKSSFHLCCFQHITGNKNYFVWPNVAVTVSVYIAFNIVEINHQ